MTRWVPPHRVEAGHIIFTQYRATGCGLQSAVLRVGCRLRVRPRLLRSSPAALSLNNSIPFGSLHSLSNIPERQVERHKHIQLDVRITSRQTVLLQVHVNTTI